MEEVKEIICPKSGTKVVLKEYLTGRERRELSTLLMKDNKMEIEDEKPKIEGLNVTTFNNFQDKTIEGYVVSINGETENILDKVLDLPEQDFKFIQDQINELSRLLEEKKSE